MIHKKYYEIMKHFLKGYDREIYGRELINQVNISQKNIALTLKELENFGMLSSKIKGGAKYFRLNQKNPLIKNFIILYEIEHNIDFFTKNSKILQIMNEIDKQDKIIIIFGSYAKETQKKDSDLDLFIIGEFDEKEIKKIGKDYGIAISIKSGSQEDFVNSLKIKNPLMEEILKSHVLVAGYEKFIEEVIKQRW